MQHWSDQKSPTNWHWNFWFLISFSLPLTYFLFMLVPYESKYRKSDTFSKIQLVLIPSPLWTTWTSFFGLCCQQVGGKRVMLRYIFFYLPPCWVSRQTPHFLPRGLPELQLLLLGTSTCSPSCPIRPGGRNSTPLLLPSGMLPPCWFLFSYIFVNGPFIKAFF